MKCPLLAIVGVHTEWGPDAAGATSDDSPQGDPGGARRRPRLRFRGRKNLTIFRREGRRIVCFSALKIRGIDADSVLDSRVKGLTAIIPAAMEAAGRPTRTRPPCFHSGRPLSFVNDAALHAAGDGYDLARDMARELVRREDHDLLRDIFRLGHLPQGHRPGDRTHALGIDLPARHR